MPTNVQALMLAEVSAGGGGGGGWTTIFSHALGASSGGWQGYNLRQVINAALLSASGSSVRLTLEGVCSIDSAYIGHQAASGDVYDFDGGQAQIKVGGSGSITLSGTPVVTDTITFSLDHSKNLIIAAHFPSGSQAIGQASSAVTDTAETYKFGADETSVSDVSGYTISSSVLSLVSKIEVM